MLGVSEYVPENGLFTNAAFTLRVSVHFALFIPWAIGGISFPKWARVISQLLKKSVNIRPQNPMPHFFTFERRILHRFLVGGENEIW